MTEPPAWHQWKPALPGLIGTAFLTLTTSFWVFWGTAEMYYEGWWGPVIPRFAYMVPGGICLGLTAIVLAWPRIGGWLLIAVGGAFSAWWIVLQYSRGFFTWQSLVTMFPVSGLLVVTGILFLKEATYRKEQRKAGIAEHAVWWKRHAHWLVAFGAPLLVFTGISSYWVPMVLMRVDDGNYGARTVEGNGVTLVWAPQGPGWGNNFDPKIQGRFRALADGEFPSWRVIALYGVEPVGYSRRKPGWEGREPTQVEMNAFGLCGYLSEDGTQLMPVRQGIWRMPTSDELVRSLTRRGANAGCKRPEAYGRNDCRTTPNKETPLWAPDTPPNYYWTGDESPNGMAEYANYVGVVNAQPKPWGNLRHGFRCVKEVKAGTPP